MPDTDTIKDYPSFPPGFWRRVVLYPRHGQIVGAMEDDMHHFHLRMDHAHGRVTHLTGNAVRHPWTGCAGAPFHLARDLEGELLADVANRDPFQHCTHLLDLAIVMAAHANDTAPSRFDMRVADRLDERTTATLEHDGEERLRWYITSTMIDGPERFAGRDLKRVSTWKHEYPADIAEQATMLRRAIFVSGARRHTLEKNRRGTEMQLARHGVCFNYRSPQLEETISLYETREFSQSGHEPLDGFEPERAFVSIS